VASSPPPGRLDYFDDINPAQGTRIDNKAPQPKPTHAYSLEEVQAFLQLFPEPAGSVFATAAFTGMRVGEIEGLRWEDLHDGQLYVSRSIWQEKVGSPKTTSSSAPVPLLRQLAERLAIHRLASGNPETGPIFRNSLGKPLSLRNVLARQILPAIQKCGVCGEPKKHLNHVKGEPRYETEHHFERDPRLPRWFGWHAARRGLSTNLYRLGVQPKVVQALLRHSDLATTMAHYVKTSSEDQVEAMKKLDLALSGHLRDTKTGPERPPDMIN
jgi:integrase